jgi:hypothetical protein
MRKLVAGLISLALTCGPCAFAEDTDSAAKPNFPHAGYLPLPPHFQPRRANAAAKVNVAPPLLPVYAQPALPEEGYLWVPGFWAWREAVPDYYWVPGTWVKPPRSGLLWTPAYWSRADGGYVFHVGYWAEEVGFYGGIDCGYGYGGDGYQGGRWEKGSFFYNKAANNLGSLRVANVYDQAISSDDEAGRVSFNGGSRGTTARPTPRQEALANEPHVMPTAGQQQHFELAAMDRALYSKLNHGEPGVAATSRAGVLEGPGITRSSALLDYASEPASAVTTGANAKK